MDKALQHLESLVVDLSRDQAADAAVVEVYREAIQRLSQRAALLQDLDEVRSCQAHGKAAVRTAHERGRPMVSASDLPVARAAVGRGEVCLGLLQRLVQRHGGAALVELIPGQALSLAEVTQGLEAAQKELAAWLLMVQQEFAAARGRWLRVLYGDRLKAFRDHEDELPDYDGKARGPLPASVAPRWYYHQQDGQIETLRFQRNKLMGRTASDQRRS